MADPGAQNSFFPAWAVSMCFFWFLGFSDGFWDRFWEEFVRFFVFRHRFFTLCLVPPLGGLPVFPPRTRGCAALSHFPFQLCLLALLSPYECLSFPQLSCLSFAVLDSDAWYMQVQLLASLVLGLRNFYVSMASALPIPSHQRVRCRVLCIVSSSQVNLVQSLKSISFPGS